MSKLLTLTLESGDKAKVPFNETSTFRITTQTWPDPAAGPVDVEQAYTGVTGLSVSEIKGDEPLPPQPGATGFESEEAAIAFAAELPLGEGAAHLERAQTKWPKSKKIAEELEVYGEEIQSTPNDSMPAAEPVTPAGTPVPPTPAEPEQPAEPETVDEVEEVEVDATDGAWEFAGENDVDLTQVTGTGADGRITKGDVEAHLAEQEA